MFSHTLKCARLAAAAQRVPREWEQSPKNPEQAWLPAPLPSSPLQEGLGQKRSGSGVNREELDLSKSQPPSLNLSLPLQALGLQRGGGKTILEAHPSPASRSLTQGLGTFQSRSLLTPPEPRREGSAKATGGGERGRGCAPTQAPTVSPGGPQFSGAGTGALGACPAGAQFEDPGRGGPARRSGRERDLTGRGQRGGLGAEPSAGRAAPKPSREDCTPWPRWSGTKVRARVPRAAHTHSLSPSNAGGRARTGLARTRDKQSPLPPPSPDLGPRGGDSGAADWAGGHLGDCRCPEPFDPPGRGRRGSSVGGVAGLLTCCRRGGAPGTPLHREFRRVVKMPGANEAPKKVGTVLSCWGQRGGVLGPFSRSPAGLGASCPRQSVWAVELARRPSSG